MFACLLAAFLSAQSVDTAYTLHQRARYGYRESNPLLGSSASGILLTKAALTTGGTLSAWRWRKSHPKAARLILLVGTLSATAATIHNARHVHP